MDTADIRKAHNEGHALFSHLFDEFGPVRAPAVVVDKTSLDLVVIFKDSASENDKFFIDFIANALGVTVDGILEGQTWEDYPNRAAEPPMQIGRSEQTAPAIAYGLTN